MAVVTKESHRMSDTNFSTAVQLILKASQEGTPKHEAVLSLGSTPQYLQDHGFPDLPLSITGRTIDKAFFDHGITKGVLERLGDIINSPKALYQSATVTATTAAVVITFELKAGSPILVPIHANKQIGRSYTNMVASVYSKEATVETRWKAQGLLLWEK